MGVGYPGSPIFHNDHGTADTSPVAGNVNGTVVVVDIYANELAKPSSSSKPPEVVDEATWVASETDDRPVDINDESPGCIYFGACCKTDVWKESRFTEVQRSGMFELAFNAEHKDEFDDRLFFNVGGDVRHEC